MQVTLQQQSQKFRAQDLGLPYQDFVAEAMQIYKFTLISHVEDLWNFIFWRDANIYNNEMYNHWGSNSAWGTWDVQAGIFWRGFYEHPWSRNAS